MFDDGCSMPERTLVTVGDFCTLNAGSTIQGHSQEDGGFKSDHIAIGSGVTVGVGAWVHYGVTMGDRSELAPDSFLMKGEEVPAGARWGGNPAGEIQDGRLPRPPPATTARRSCRERPAPRQRATRHPRGGTGDQRTPEALRRGRPMDVAVDTGRAFWTEVLGAGGVTTLPRWARGRSRGWGPWP